MNPIQAAIVYFALGLLGAMLCSRSKDFGSLFVKLLLFAAVFLLCPLFISRVSQSAAQILSYVKNGALLMLIGGLLGALGRAFIGKPNKKYRSAEAAAVGKARRSARTKAVLLLLPLLVLAASGTVVFNSGLISSNVLDSTISTDAAIKHKTMNLLVCGIDNASNDEAHSQMMTDVIIVANVDLENGTAALLQIPRDTYVGEATSSGKINAVYNAHSDPHEGIRALANELNSDLRLPLDGYVTITMEGFRAAVDAMGGIEITLEKEMSFNMRDAQENLTGVVTLPAGTQVLDGATADLFVRYREYTRADLDRINMQRYFLGALMNKAKTLSATELMNTVSDVYPYLDTDLTVSELVSLALKVKDFTDGAVTVIRMPGEPTMLNNQSVFSAHRAALAEQLNLYMRPHSEPVDVDELGIIELSNTTDILDDSVSALDDYR